MEILDMNNSQALTFAHADEYSQRMTTVLLPLEIIQSAEIESFEMYMSLLQLRVFGMIEQFGSADEVKKLIKSVVSKAKINIDVGDEDDLVCWAKALTVENSPFCHSLFFSTINDRQIIDLPAVTTQCNAKILAHITDTSLPEWLEFMSGICYCPSKNMDEFEKVPF
jgi:hypothetical protein